MNDISSPYDKFSYKCEADILDDKIFLPVGGINPMEWANITDIARALEYIGFLRGVSCNEIKTKKGYYEKDLQRAFENLVSALAKGIIEVDERRKMRMSKGYGKSIREDDTGNAGEDSRTRPA